MFMHNYENFRYKFPVPQYLGAKHLLLNWLIKFIPKNLNIALDAFAGSLQGLNRWLIYLSN